MVSVDCSRTVLGVLLIVADVLSMVKIERLLVPEVVQSGNTSGAILDCQYSAVGVGRVQWLFGGGRAPVYEWSPGTQPQVNGLLRGRVDLSYRASSRAFDERRALFLMDLAPELSGEYTCKIISNSTEVQQTKAMLVYSPERDFELELYQQHQDVEIKCRARGLYPQPELTIERNGEIIAKQQQRVWRGEGALYDAECWARAPPAAALPSQIACRLQLPAAGYTAIKKFLQVDAKNGNLSSENSASNACIFLAILTAVYSKGLQLISTQF